MQNDIVKQPPENTDVAPQPQPIQDVAKPSEAVADAPSEQPVASPEQKSDGPQGQPEAPSETQPVAHETPAEPPAPKPKSSLPKGIIAGAAVMCTALVGAVLYLTVNGTEKPQTPTSTPAATQQKISPEEVKNTANEAGTLPEADADVAPELTDQSLGL